MFVSRKRFFGAYLPRYFRPPKHRSRETNCLCSDIPNISERYISWKSSGHPIFRLRGFYEDDVAVVAAEHAPAPAERADQPQDAAICRQVIDPPAVADRVLLHHGDEVPWHERG